MKNTYKWIIELIIEYAIKLFLMILVVFIFNQVMLGNISSGLSSYIREYIEVDELKFHKAYQFFNYLGDLLRFDLGTDPSNNAVTSFYITPGLINSSLLFFPSIIFSVLISYWFGKSYYLGKRTFVSNIIKTLSVFISSIPIYWLAFIFFLLIIVSSDLVKDFWLFAIPLLVVSALFFIFWILRNNHKNGARFRNKAINIGFNFSSGFLVYWIIAILFLILGAGKPITQLPIRFILPVVFIVILAGYLIHNRKGKTPLWFLKRVIISSVIFTLFYALLLLYIPETGFNIGGSHSWYTYDKNFVIVIIDRIWHLILPWIPMVTLFTVVLSQAIQSKIRQLEDADFIKMAQAKGLPKNVIFKKHLSSPVWAELLSTLSSYLPFFITYLVVVELVFMYNGLGHYCITRSYPVQNAAILFLGMFVIVVQFLNNFLMKILIPYIRREQGINIKPASNYWFLLFILAFVLFSVVQNAFINSPIITIDNFNLAIRLIVIFFIIACSFIWLYIKRKKQLISFKPIDKNIFAKKDINIIKVDNHTNKLSKIREQVMTISKKKALLKVIIGLSIVLIIIALSFIFQTNINDALFISRETISGYWNPTFNYPMGVINTLGVKLDYLELILVAGRYLLVPIISAIIGLIIGTLLGVVSGLWKSFWDKILTRFFEFVEMFPSVLLLIIMLTFFNRNIFGFTFTLISIGSARVYRIVREEVIILRQQEFIVAVKLLGSNFWNILRKHIIPNIRNLFISSVFYLIADFILLDATLIYITGYEFPSFLSNIIPIQGWGFLISSSINLFVRGYILIGLFPGIFLIGTIAIFRWIGDNASILVDKNK